MRKPPPTIESTHRSTAYRTRPLAPAVLDPALLFMPRLSGLRQQLQLANDFQHQFEIDQSNQPTGGRPATLWSAIPEFEYLAEAESHDESTAEEKTNEESMQQQT